VGKLLEAGHKAKKLYNPTDVFADELVAYKGTSLIAFHLKSAYQMRASSQVLTILFWG